MPHPLWTKIAPLSAAQIEQLDRYLDLLLDWNQRINLTRIIDRPDAQRRHIADALTLVPLIPDDAKTLIDVGTGGGVPGLVLAIARPTLKVTLLDSTRKKLDVIDAMIAELRLPNVATRHARIESIDDRFDLITARAVAELKQLVAWCGPMLHRGATLLAMKGPRAVEEVADANNLLDRLGLEHHLHVVQSEELVGHVIVRITPAKRGAEPRGQPKTR